MNHPKLFTPKKETETMSQQAFDFNMDHILQRYCEEQDVSMKTAKEHERELKRYLILCSQSNIGYPMFPVIDELWHLFIIFTYDYHQFCKILGRDYIHHQPKVPGIEFQNLPERFEAFVTNYQENFEELPPEKYWPSTKQAWCKGNCSYCSGPSCESEPSCGDGSSFYPGKLLQLN